MEKVGLSGLTGGALQEKFDRAMESVINNMQDPNTPWKNKRGITIKLVFEQNEDRSDATVNISVETKTAPVKQITTRMAVGKDLETGDVFAQEYGNQIRGQMSMDLSTGEVKETGNVLDFRAAKQA